MRVLRSALQPVPLLFITLGLSLLCWLVPGSSYALRGFDERAATTFGAWLVLIGWYCLVAGVAAIGMAMGRRLLPVHRLDLSSDDKDNSAFENRLIIALTVFATIGVGTVVLSAGGLAAILDAVVRTDANSLKDATGGSAGIQTLRYAASVSAPIALHRALSRRRGWGLAVWNFALLALTGVIASRLSFIIASIVFLYLLANRATGRKVKVRTVVVTGVIVAAVLVFLNYSRNARFYAANGVGDPLMSNTYQMLTYLGSPFQVSISVANQIMSQPGAFARAPASPEVVLLPSFVSNYLSPVDVAARYNNLVSINPSLTTNSAFADTLASFGTTGLILSLVLILLAGFVFSHFAQYRSYVCAVSGVIAYGFADYWRILVFNQGILIFCVLAVILSAFFATALRRPATQPQVGTSL